MALVAAVGPAKEPITLAVAKAHCRIDIDDDDEYMDGLIVAARRLVERRCRHALITQTWDWYMDGWPDGDALEVPYPPLSSVSYIKYTNDDGVTTAFAAANYVVDTYSTPGRIVLASGADWPSDTLREVNGVNVRFVAGFGADPDDVPRELRQALLLLVGHWYENREPMVVTGAMPKALSFTVDALVEEYRARAWDW